MWSYREIMCYKYLYFSLSQRQEEPNIRHELTPSFRSSVWWIQSVNGWINNVHSAGSYAVSHREDKEWRPDSIRQRVVLMNRFVLMIQSNRSTRSLYLSNESVNHVRLEWAVRMNRTVRSSKAADCSWSDDIIRPVEAPLSSVCVFLHSFSPVWLNPIRF